MARQSFGKYEVLARLATGGAASIFLARQPGAAGFNKLVVLKTLLPERASDDDFVRMFLDEARLAARLHHPNCVQIYDLGRVQQVYYISMEYIFGETLWNLLTTVTRLKTALPPTHVAAIIANVCDGLHHAHELKDKTGRRLNLVHRDVSPQNVMISFAGQTKVVDFGIAKAETDRPPTVAGIVKGKFSYMSPEQITGNPVDRRSDIYSLGIVMFECLASRRLYRGDSPEDIARLILEHRAPRLRDVVPDIPAPLDEICARALSRQPHRRFQTAQAMGGAIREYLDAVRFKGSAAVISRLMSDRFGDLVTRRRQAYEAALAGAYDETFLCEVLNAQPVRHIDLYAEESLADLTADAVPLHKAVLSPEAARTMPQSGTQAERGASRRNGPGWRVELSTSLPVEPEVSVVEVDHRAPGPGAYDAARTRLDPDRSGPARNGAIRSADEARTRVDDDESPTSWPPQRGLVTSGGDGWDVLRSIGMPVDQTGPTGPNGEQPTNPFNESTPFDEMANDLTAHPDPALELSRRLDRLPDPQDLLATVHEGDEEAMNELGSAVMDRLLAVSPPSPPAAVIPIREDTESDPPDMPSVQRMLDDGVARALAGPSGAFARPPPLPPVAVGEGRPTVEATAALRSPSVARRSSRMVREVSGPHVMAVESSGPHALAPEGLGPLVVPARKAPRRRPGSISGRPSVADAGGVRPTTAPASRRLGEPSAAAPAETPAKPARYSLSVVMAALAFGLAIGTIAGVSVTRLVFAPLLSPTPGVVMPSSEAASGADAIER